MAVITMSGRAGMARSIKNSPLYIAWGQGPISAESSNERLPEDPTQSSLAREVGRRIVDDVQFVVGDDQGALVTPTGRWTVSNVPTNNLYISATFDFENANGYTIREYGLFVNTEVSSECPPGQRYFLPTDLVSPGELLMLENCVPLIRTGDTRHECNFVMSL
jgi:hypothetical protein